MHKFLLYASYGWLLLVSLLHFSIDVLSHYWRGERTPGVDTLYFGLHSAYTLGQVLIAVVALLLIRNGVPFFGEWPGWVLGFTAAAAWLAVCVAFISYREPRIVIGLFAILLAGAVLAK